MKKFLYAFLVLSVLLLGCTSQPAGPEPTGTASIAPPVAAGFGTLVLKITDAPLDGLAVLNVVISGVEVHSAEGEWISFSEEEQSFDLMQLQGVADL
ncbi:MAG: DUF4382 domain-containing protein, partial [Candidatus Micrarchaeota archaeon]